MIINTKITILWLMSQKLSHNVGPDKVTLRLPSLESL